MMTSRRRLRLATVLLAGLLYSSTGSAQADAQRLNRFNDPFFQISSAIQNCPVPAGPFITEAERLIQSHHRAELGTTCWLAHQCDRPTYYAYDQDIAKGLKASLQEHGPFDNTTLWITVQGRVVFIEGCVKDEKIYTELEALARSVPYVQQAIAAVYSNPAERPPYKLLSSP